MNAKNVKVNAACARLSRRHMLQTAGAAGLAAIGAPAVLAAADKAAKDKKAPAGKLVTKGRIKQSVAEWCFTKNMTLDQLAKEVVAMGVTSIELVDIKNWPVLKKHGLICALANSHGFVDGFNRPDNYDMCIAKIKESVDACVEFGFPTVITFTGFRKGMPDDVGLKNTVAGLKKVIGYAEQKKINLCLEVLNSRVDVEMKGHPDYMCDNVEFAAEVCKQIASPRMTFLFDIYHIQVMQGDIITRIKKYHEYIGHYHTAGVPGRNEIDDTQELNYPAIMRVIAETKYAGYVGQEFIPTRDPMTSLREAVKMCDV
jgi:hydroxypyruvate isomerase